MVFCKMVICDWNRWDPIHKRHVCNKIVPYLNKNGECALAVHTHKRGGREEPKSEDKPSVLADTEIRMNCAFLDDVCVDCVEDCPCAGGVPVNEITGESDV